MHLGYFGSSMFYLAMFCSLLFEGYSIMHASKYAAAKWDRLKANPVSIHGLDVVYSIFIVVLLFTPYWKHGLLILVVSIVHTIIVQQKKMQYHIFIADGAICFITLMSILAIQLRYF